MQTYLCLASKESNEAMCSNRDYKDVCLLGIERKMFNLLRSQWSAAFKLKANSLLANVIIAKITSSTVQITVF